MIGPFEDKDIDCVVLIASGYTAEASFGMVYGVPVEAPETLPDKTLAEVQYRTKALLKEGSE